MRIERLLEIIILLLNKGVLTGKQLADYFGVSIRTIQRDITALSAAGIPIIAEEGSRGGYSILENYKLSNSFVNKEDFNIIIMALHSLSSSYDSKRLNSILEKYLSVTTDHSPPIFIDYSVTREGGRIQNNNKILENSIKECSQVTFQYINANGAESKRIVNPYALKFKWYSWYLFAYDTIKNDYRTFKVARISKLEVNKERFDRPQNVESLITAQEQDYYKNCEHILVSCSNESIVLLEETFPDAEFQVNADGSWLMDLYVPLSEKMWQALLLGLEDKVKIIAPLHYRDMLINMAKKFINNYDS